MGFSSTTTFAPSSVAAILASLFSDTASPQTMNEPTSLVPVGVLDPKVMNMVNFPMNLGIIEFFIDVLVAAVARAVIASRYKAAPPMKTPLLMRCIIEYIVRGLLDTRTILTAVVYLSDIRLTAYDMGDFVCERLAIGALMLAHKANNEPSYPGSQWFKLAQVAFGSSGLHLTRKGLNKIEREFLACLDWQVMPTTEKLLDHHDVFMRYARRDLEVYSVTQAQMATTCTRPIPVPERAEPTYPRATLSVAAADLPDLMYPDTPSLSDGYSSDSSAGIITPPSSGHAYAASGSHTGRVGPTRKGRSPPCPYSRPPRRMSSHRTPGYGQNDPRSTITITSSTAVDSAMEARIRFYAADRGTVLRECGGSPRYVPYSPSQRWLHRRDRYDSAPTPSPSSAIAAELAAWNASLGFNSSSKREFAAPPTSTYPPYRRAEDPFCRRYQSWSSTMPGVAANDKWGTFGLFRQ